MANQVVFDIIGQAQSYVAAMSKSEAAALGLDKTNELLARHGIKTAEVYREQLIELEHLTKEVKNDALATAQLTKKKEALTREMHGLTGATEKTTSNFGGLATAVKGFIALQGIQFLMDMGRAGLEASRGVLIMESAIEAANREFGDNVGTLDHWREVARRLGDEFGHLSETQISNAISRTVDMTKRLGLNADQMEVVLSRSVDLAAGKTDLTGAVERVTAALRGEAESAEFLGLSLSETSLKNFLLANGMDEKLIPALDEAQKAQFRYLLFLEQTNETQGRAAAILDETAGRVDRLAGQWDKAKENIGGFLLRMLDVSGIMDLASGDVEMFGAKMTDALTFGTSKLLTGSFLSEQLQKQRDLLTRMMEQGEQQGDNNEEAEKTLTLQEQIKQIISETEAAIRSAGDAEEARAGKVNKTLGEYNRFMAEQAVKDYEKAFSEFQKKPKPIKLTTEQVGTELDIIGAGADEIQGDFSPISQASIDAITQMKTDWVGFFTSTDEGLKHMSDISGNVFGGFADAASIAFDATGQKVKAFFGIYKAFAIGQAVMDTYASAVAAYKSTATIPLVGPALAPIAAAAAVAFGLANVARIASAKPGGGAGGGASGGGSASGRGSPVSSYGASTRTAAPANTLTSPAQTGLLGASTGSSAFIQSMQAMDKATRTLEEATRKIPDRLTTELSGDNLLLVTDRASEKQRSGLGDF